MTQPYPPQFGQQAPPAPQQYAPQQPQQPYAPPQNYPAQPQQGYPVGPPAGQQYQQPQYAPPQYGPPQGYAPQPQYAPPAPQMPAQAASLGSFFEQPSSGWGPAWQLGNAVQDGTSYIGIVAQWITKAHLEYATSKNQQGVEEVRTFKNGDPVVNMKVPLNVVPDQRFTDGRAQFYVGPGEKDLLAAAIAANGGDPTQPPTLGSMIRATKTGSRGNIHGGRSAIKTVEYWGPEQAQQFAQQLGIPYPDLNTPRPVDEPKHAAPEPAPVAQGGNSGGNVAAPPVFAAPPVQQQAAAPQPQMQQGPVQQAPPVGPPQGMPPAPQALQQLPPQAPPMAGPPAPGNAPQDPKNAALLASLLGQAPLPPAA